jgi:2-dehydropantoate 2-reductase
MAEQAPPLRICVLGAGGLGTVLAGYLARSGNAVTLWVRPEHEARYAAGIVRISGLGSFETPMRIASRVDEGGAFDYLLICVKARDTEAALAPLRDVRFAAALSLQNGVRKDETLLRAFGRQRVLGAVTMVGGELLAPGASRHMLAGPTLVGELDGSVSARSHRLAQALEAAGLPAVAVPAIVAREWQKLATFLPGALICALTRLDLAASLVDHELVQVRLRLAREIAAVAAAEGHAIDGLPVFLTAASLQEEERRRAGAGEPAAVPCFAAGDDRIAAAFITVGNALQEQGAIIYPSLLQDVVADRPTELEETAGDLLHRAAVHGVPTPSLLLCTALVRGVAPARPLIPAD